jgi:hypothetical protein
MNITWYCPESNFTSYPNKIEEANFRIRVWYNHLYFLKEGHQSVIAHKKEDVRLSDILVLTSFGEDCFDLAKMFKGNGRKVVHDYSENIRGIPILEATKRLCDKIICCSTWLRDEEAKVYGSKSVSVDGPYEPSPVRHDPEYENNPLKVVWCGNGGNAGIVRSLLKPIIESLGMEYV